MSKRHAKHDRTRPRLEAKLAIQIMGHDDVLEMRHVNINKESLFIHIHDWKPQIDSDVDILMAQGLRQRAIRFYAKVQRVVSPNQFIQAQGVVLVFSKIEPNCAKAFDQLLSDLFEGRGLGCRKTPRAQLVTSVDISLANMKKTAELKDISKGGAFLLMDTSEIHHVNMELGLTLIHPTTKRKFVLKGLITRIQKKTEWNSDSNEEGIGIQFYDLTPVRKKDLDLFLRNLIFTKQRKKKEA